MGVPASAYKLDVAGGIHAATSQGVVLDAQDRPLITRGWDPFTSGTNVGLGRWGLFMETNRLTFGVPVQANNGFQWATYSPNSTVGSTLMTLSQEGNLGIGNPLPSYPLDVAGAIRATTDKGILLNAQDRPLITRGWDAFTSGNYSGVGRWGLFMEINRLTFGVPVQANNGFQWATYNANSTVGSTLMTLSQEGRLGIGNPIPNYPLDVTGSIHATTDKGILLNPQDRPLITRGWDPFVSGNYTGAGRWGLFMEVNRLTFGVPQQVNDGFQWVTYTPNSTVANTLMTLTQEGNLGVGVPAPAATLEIARGSGNSGSLGVVGTNRESFFNYGSTEETYIRGGKGSSNVILNDNGGAVGVGTPTVAAGEMLDVNGSTRTIEVHTPATGAANMLALAYGQGGSAGIQLFNASGNVSQTKIGTGHYRLIFTGLAAIDLDVAPISLSLNGAGAGFITSEGITGGTGTIDVYTYSTSNVLTDRYFNFVLFRP